MADGKKSFVLYADLLKSIEHLTNEEKGVLFNHLLEYVNDLNPILDDRLILTAWKPIEMQLKRDLKKFEDVKVKRSEAGKRSAELRALKSVEQNQTNSTLVESVKECSTNPTDNVNDNDNVNVNVNDINNNISEIKNFESVSNKSISKKKLIENFKEEILLNGADEKDLDDWINIRKEKKTQFSERALNTFLNECKKNNFPIHEAVKICADKGWAGFNFDWIKKENNGRTEQNDISNPKIGRARLSDYEELYRQMVDE